MDAKKIERIIARVGETLTEKFNQRVKEDGVHIIGFDGKNLKIREVWKDSNGHYHQSKNIKDTIGQFFKFHISYIILVTLQFRDINVKIFSLPPSPGCWDRRRK